MRACISGVLLGFSKAFYLVTAFVEGQSGGMTQATTPSAISLPNGIEIFRAGTHVSDEGETYVFTAQDLADIAASYKPELKEAPLTVGHPESDRPAYGWVESVSVDGDVLLMTTRQVEAQFAQMVADGRFKKRSACFYPPNSPNNPTRGKWYLRHVAFLGAQPPAVAGLKDIQFQDGEDAVRFSDFCDGGKKPPTPLAEIDMSKELQEQLEAARAEAEKAKAEAEQARKEAEAERAKSVAFAEQARADRKAGFVAFAEAQIDAGKLLPKDKEMAVNTLQVLADVKPVQFSEGDTTRTVSHAQWLQELISNGPTKVAFGEFAPVQPQTTVQPGGAKGKTDAEIDTAAQQYARQHKVSYAEALGAVTASFTA